MDNPGSEEEGRKRAGKRELGIPPPRPPPEPCPHPPPEHDPGASLRGPPGPWFNEPQGEGMFFQGPGRFRRKRERPFPNEPPFGLPDEGFPKGAPAIRMPFPPEMPPRMPQIHPPFLAPRNMMMGPPRGPMGNFVPPNFGPGGSGGDFAQGGFDGFGGFGGGPDFGGMGPGMNRNKYRKVGGWGGRSGGRGGGGGQMGKSRAEGNDYNQHFVDTGQRPQNFLRDSQLEDQYADYPNAKRLVMLKDSIISNCTTPPYYLKADLKELDLSTKTFGTKFDVVLIDPPWEEYVRRAPGVGDGVFWKWQEIMELRIDDVMDSPSFVFLWCGSEEGLDAGRHCLNRWGYRRCEDIVWIKTNKDRNRKYLNAVNQEALSVLQHNKEHCLMGIKGTVRRTTDGHVIHANVDTDVMVSEEPPLGSTEKPEQMYSIIERFCLGRRRLELFGQDNNIRPGWVTVGNKLSASNFKLHSYAAHFSHPDGSPFISTIGRPQPGQPNLLPSTEEIESLRPKSPPPMQNN